jgi:catechol 2,3-dioxygenase-like lactoylglutathione lyase family enzyme
MIRLEHANLSVKNSEELTRFILAAFPDFRIRGEGSDAQGRAWRHVGNDDFYVALQSVPQANRHQPYGNDGGLNHLGWEVDDLEALETRMRKAGFEPNMTDDSHPARTRCYFYDPDGNDWEFVSYASTDPAERNDYSR